MKLLKVLSSSLLATTLAFCSIIMPAYAAEENENVSLLEKAEFIGTEYTDDGTKITTYEAEINPEDFNNPSGIVALSLDQSFTMTSSHRGGDRTYSGNYLQYSVTVTDTNGNAVDNTVSVKLYDYNHSYALSNTSVKADGSTTTVRNVSITPGRVYYFKYARTSGASRTLKVRMRITDYN